MLSVRLQASSSQIDSVTGGVAYDLPQFGDGGHRVGDMADHERAERGVENTRDGRSGRAATSTGRSATPRR